MSEPYSTQPGPRSRNVPLLVILCAIGVLLLAIVVLLAFILFRPSSTTASAPVTASPSGTVTSAPSPAATLRTTSSPTVPSGEASGSDSGTGSGANSGIGSGAGGASESAPSPTPTEVKKPLMQVFNTHGVQVVCVTGTDAVPAQLNFDLKFDYSARDTTAVYIGVDTNDAVANPFEGPLPATGSVVVPFSCYGPHTYSFAAVGADGSRDEGSVTLVNQGDPDPNAK